MPKRLKMVLLVIKQTILTCSHILNLEGHQNRFIGSKVTVILLIWWILSTGGVTSGRVCTAACAAGLFNVSTKNFIFAMANIQRLGNDHQAPFCQAKILGPVLISQ